MLSSLRREHFRATSLSSHPRKAPKNQNHAHLPSQAKRRLHAAARGSMNRRIATHRAQFERILAASPSCGGRVACLSDTGAFVLVWDATVAADGGVSVDVAAVTAVPTHDKTVLGMTAAPPRGSDHRVVLASERGLTVLSLRTHRVDASCDVVVRKATDESVGAIFRSDNTLVWVQL